MRGSKRSRLNSLLLSSIHSLTHSFILRTRHPPSLASKIIHHPTTKREIEREQTLCGCSLTMSLSSIVFKQESRIPNVPHGSCHGMDRLPDRTTPAHKLIRFHPPNYTWWLFLIPFLSVTPTKCRQQMLLHYFFLYHRGCCLWSFHAYFPCLLAPSTQAIHQTNLTEEPRQATKQVTN